MDSVNAKNLQELKNLSSFSLSQLEKFADNLSVRNYRKNEIVFDQDQEAKLVYILTAMKTRSLSVYFRLVRFSASIRWFQKLIIRSAAKHSRIQW